VPLDELWHLGGIGDVTANGAGVNLGERIVERLAVAKCLVDRRVEAVQDAQLELVGTFEEVLKSENEKTTFVTPARGVGGRRLRVE
jgi:hypothetical protein